MSLLLRDLNGCGMQIKWSVLCSTWPSTPSASWSIVVVPTRSGTATLTPGSCGRHPQQSPDSQCAPPVEASSPVAHTGNQETAVDAGRRNPELVSRFHLVSVRQQCSDALGVEGQVEHGTRRRDLHALSLIHISEPTRPY